MHADLVLYWIRIAALLVTPVAPHFAEHIYTAIFNSPTSIQNALWPAPAKAVDPAIIEAAAYMSGTIKTIRDAEGALVKMLNKTRGKKGGADLVDVFDPNKPKSVQIYVATSGCSGAPGPGMHILDICGFINRFPYNSFFI